MTDPYMFQGRLYPTINDAKRAAFADRWASIEEAAAKLDPASAQVIMRRFALEEGMVKIIEPPKWWMFWRSKEHAD